MDLIPLSSIRIADRQRTSMKPEGLETLRESILSVGLIHAPVCRREGDDLFLVAGERRLTAIREIAAQEKSFVYSGTLVPPGMVPITLLSDPTPANIAAAEAEENIFREDLSWPDMTRALARIRELREAEGKSLREIATDLADKGQSLGRSKTVEGLRFAMTRAAVVAKHLDNPDIAKARNEREAYNKILAAEQRTATAALNQAASREAGRDSLWTLVHGDSLLLMPEMPDGQFDAIICDPPYGQGARAASTSQNPDAPRPLATHTYNDTPQAAMALMQAILLEGFRLCRPRASLFMFINPKFYSWVDDAARRAGWEPYAVPLIWSKGVPGFSPWGSQGPSRSYEMLFFARKGQKGFYRPMLDVLHAKKVPPSLRLHAAQKPYGVLKPLIEAATLADDLILDPVAGCGSILRAARLLGRRSHGIEIDLASYELAINFIDSDREEREAQHDLGLAGL